MHVFLTGEIQTGKTTAINRALEILKLNIGGFRTEFINRSSTDRTLHIIDAGHPDSPAPDNIIVEFKHNVPHVFVDRFDSLGVKYIRNASQTAQLILMDECGVLETNAVQFKKTVIDTLDGSKPVLGVVRSKASNWLDQIRNYPNVHLITVTLDNRENVPSEIIRMLTT